MALVLTRLVRSNYDELDNIPIIHQDLTASFTKQADTYYIHTGSTTSAYTKGRMYYCDGTNLKKVVVVDELPTVNNGTLTITVNGTAHTFTANQSGNTSFSITDTDTGATSVEVTGTGNAVTAASYNASTRKLTLTKGATFLTSQDISGLMPKSGGTFTGEVKFGSTENFQGYYIKRMLGSLSAGTAYNNLDSKYKDGTYHRMWRLRFPNGSSFWGKIKVTLYGDYSSFNASGLMSKSITCNFNTSTIYNNVGCYDGLGVNVERDFRISEAIWNDTASAWEVLIWQENLNGNNPATIMLECWTKNNTNYIKAFNGIAAQAVELTQSTSYSAQKASPTGGTKTVEWAALPVYENPLGEEIATMSDLSNKANLNGENTFTGKQLFNNTVNGVTNQLALNETQWDIFTCRDLTSPTTKTAIGKGYVWCQDNDSIYSQFKATGIYYGNDTSGYEGTLKFPTNISGEKTIATTSDIPTFSYNSSTKALTIS